MKHELLHVMDQDAAGALNHALRQTRGPRGEHDIERMLEGKLLELDLQTALLRQKLPVMNGLGNGADVGLVFGVGNDNDFLDRRKILQDFGHAGNGIEALALEEVAVGRKKDLRLDLSEAIQDPLDPEIGGAGGPNRPDAGRRQHCRYGFGHVRQKTGNTIARADAACFEALRQSRDPVVEFGIGDPDGRTILALEDQGHGIVPEAQKVFRKVQTRAGKPFGAGHFFYVVDHPIIMA